MKLPRSALFLACLLAAAPPQAAETAHGFMLRTLAGGWQHTDPMAGGEDGAGAGLVGRYFSKIGLGEALTVELNVFQTWLDHGLAGSGVDTFLAATERSDALEHNFSERDFTHLGVDTLSLGWRYRSLDLTLGRQPINLATTFYFSVNDVFAPFAARDFSRIYKPGVDALRADLALSELSGLHLYLVNGYRPDPDSDTGWERSPDPERRSLLTQINGVLVNWDLSLIGGRLRGRGFYASGAQGEIGDWLGLRLEAQWRESVTPGQGTLLSHVLGLEHRFDNSLDLRLELFRNGRGVSDTAAYPLALISAAFDYPGEPLYLARHYLALGASYQLTPLWVVQGLLIVNRIDRSAVVSVGAQYSLTDEADLVLGFTGPYGDKSRFGIPRSEFGSLPRLLNAEVRMFF